jgi:2',3'-cyclic-nucleotide 2'-phosphodiesterase (5'-nucleotidase family)
MKALKLRSKMEAPAIFVDAGNLFSDDRFVADQLAAEVMTKNKWVVKGYNDFRHTAANVNYNDLPYLATMLKKDGYGDRVKQFPFIKRLVSANVVPADDQLVAPDPYVIREVVLKRGAAGKKLKIGIVGFTEARPMGGDIYAGYKIENPFEAAKRILPDLKQKVDVVVALAYMPLVDAQRLATENAEIDTVIGARKASSLDEPQHFSNATITYAFDQTKYLGELRYFVKPDGSIEKQSNRFVIMDEAIPNDRDAQQIVNDAHTEFTNDQSKTARLAPERHPGALQSRWRLPEPALALPALFAPYRAKGGRKG